MSRIFRRSSLKARLLATIQKDGGEYRGVYRLSLAVGHERWTVVRALRCLQAAGEIDITPGAPGRGNAAIIKICEEVEA